jgi:aldose 1-epimerase
MSRYSTRHETRNGIAIVRLADELHGIDLAIAPSIGNRAYEMLVRGKNILYCPFDDLSRLKAEAHHLNGIPFLAPWANRMPEGFHVNGEAYRFNTNLSSIRLDSHRIPIHGMLTASPFWEVIEVRADEASASVTSRFEFWRHPELMANWPFAHSYEMTYRLAEGSLEVSVAVTNLCAESMPAAAGFHPYFQLPDVPRNEMFARIPARLHVEVDNRLVATGDTKPVTFPERLSLKEYYFDDGFTGLITGADGHAKFNVEGRGMKIEVVFGPKYRVAIIYAPAGREFICFEPMAAITNGVNLAHEGKYGELQTILPGGEWRESFWIRPTGF